MEKEIQTNLRELHLPAIRACYKEQSDLARAESYSYEQYLLNLIGYECQTRREKRIARFLKESKLPLEKTLSSFDRKRLPQRVNAQLGVLLEGTFLDRCENILAFGNPGSGKHICCVQLPRN
jgi:DNA replication protein DnaC